MKHKDFEDSGFIRTLAIIKHKKVSSHGNKPKKEKDKPDYSKERKKKRNWDE